MAHNTPQANPPRVFYSPSYKSIVNNLVSHVGLLRQCAHGMTLVIEAAQSRREHEIKSVLELVDDQFTLTLDALETDLVDFQMLVEKTKLEAHNEKVATKRQKTKVKAS